jgi:hypothetical protein
MIKNTIRKANSRKGESIAEVLMASLVISLAVVLLVTMVSSSKRLVEKADQAFEWNISFRNTVESGGEFDSSDPHHKTVSGTLQIEGGSITDGENHLMIKVDGQSIRLERYDVTGKNGSGENDVTYEWDPK